MSDRPVRTRITLVFVALLVLGLVAVVLEEHRSSLRRAFYGSFALTTAVGFFALLRAQEWGWWLLVLDVGVLSVFSLYLSGSLVWWARDALRSQPGILVPVLAPFVVTPLLAVVTFVLLVLDRRRRT
ncbi:MAG TPA: hypothetical protein VEJ18_00175 [Planctomycetota bacterium]|nr:hypothetical protein [Planctomycetota bacterium]